jgi:nucleotidyltransferase substrate binding protein (TIGR01987 family)
MDSGDENNMKKENFIQALKKLETFLASKPESELEKTGIIQSFEYTFEAAWKYLQETAQEAGFECNSPKSALTCGIQMGLIPLSHEAVWSEMLKDRNLTSHTYQGVLLETLFVKIRDLYATEFSRLK